MPISLNGGQLRTADLGLKLAQMIVGAACLGLMADYNLYGYIATKNTAANGIACMFIEGLVFYMVAFAFLLTSFLLFVSALLSNFLNTPPSKTLFEFLYHLFAFLLFFSVSIAFLVRIQKAIPKEARVISAYKAWLAASILGFFNAASYLLGAIVSFKTYRAD